MGLFSTLGEVAGDFFGVPGVGSVVGSFLDSPSGTGLVNGVLGYEGQQSTNSANAAINQSNNAFNADQAALNRSWSADQAQKQMDFQSLMSNTQWQRSVDDMEKAGLSPMLAYMKGPNSSPSGAMGSSSAASAASPIAMGNPISAGLNAANTAVDTVNKVATTGLINAQTNATAAGAQLTQEQTSQVAAATQKIKAETDKIEGDTNIPAQQAILRNTALMLDAQRQLFLQQGNTQTDTQNMLQATVNKLVAETGLVNLDIKAANDMGNFGREAGQLKPILDLIINAIRLHR